MKKSTIIWSMVTAATLGITSCVNSDYDLSDIDTNVEFKVQELTMPIKMDAIKLGAVLDIDDNDENIKQMKDPMTGKEIYAVVKEGTFESDEIKLDPITVDGKQFDPMVINAMLKTYAPSAARPKKANSKFDYYYDLTDACIDLNKYEGDIDLSNIKVESIKDISVDFTVQTTLDIATQLAGKVNTATLENLAIKLIDGLEDTPVFDGYIEVGSYRLVQKGMTSVLKITDPVQMIPNQKTLIKLHVDKIYGDAIRAFIDVYEKELKKSGRKSVESIANSGKQHFVYNAKIEFLDGFIGMNEEDLAPSVTPTDLPSVLNIITQPETTGITVKEFSGVVTYDLTDKMDIPDVNLENLPEFLTEEGTEIKFQNPQLYININNPVQDGDNATVHAQTGLIFDNHLANRITIDVLNADRPNNIFCIAPEKIDKMYKDEKNNFNGAQMVTCADLGNILSTNGKGLPKTISIQPYDAKVEGNVTDIDLTKTYAPASGKYLFYVPLALGNGSKIAYSNKVDGWYDEDMKDLKISTLSIKAKVSTDVPMRLTLKAYPLDRNGKHMNNVEPATCDLPANAKNADVNLELKGSLRDLDGVDFKITLESSESGQALSPDMNIKLEGIKATVTGSYATEL